MYLDSWWDGLNPGVGVIQGKGEGGGEGHMRRGGGIPVLHDSIGGSGWDLISGGKRVQRS